MLSEPGPGANENPAGDEEASAAGDCRRAGWRAAGDPGIQVLEGIPIRLACGVLGSRVAPRPQAERGARMR